MEARVTRGLFVTLEGPDGAGKSVQAARLAGALRDGGRDVVLTREPGGTPLGESIRAAVLGGRGATPERDALLFSAARAVLVADVIRPALGRGSIVVCDRFADSTTAYQGFGAGVDRALLADLERLATDGLTPDVTILLDVPVGVALERRVAGPAEEQTRFELDSAHDRSFHQRVREGYLALARAERGRWRVIDAARPVDEVARSVLSAVSAVLADRDREDRRRSEPLTGAGRTRG
jgi:dTMP kinase